MAGVRRYPDRPREMHAEPSSPAFRYWELYDQLVPGQAGEATSALAYPRRWSPGSKKWITIKNDALRKSVWSVHGHFARKGQIVTTVTIENGRHEVVEVVKQIYKGTVTQTGGIAGGATGDVLLAGVTETVRNPFGDNVENGASVLVSDAAGELVLWFPGGEGGGSAAGIPFRNDSQETIPPHGVMFCPSSTLILGVKHYLALKPTSYLDLMYLVNGPTAVAPSATSLGSWLSESGPVAIDTAVPPSSGHSWGVKPGSWVLHPDGLCFWLSDATTQTINGQATVHAIQTPLREVFIKLYTKLEPGGTAQCEIWLRQNNKWRRSPFDNIVAVDWYFNKEDSAEPGTKGEAHWYSNRWVIRNLYCEKDNTSDSGQQTPSQLVSLDGAQLSGQSLAEPTEPSFDPLAGFPSA